MLIILAILHICIISYVYMLLYGWIHSAWKKGLELGLGSTQSDIWKVISAQLEK